MGPRLTTFIFKYRSRRRSSLSITNNESSNSARYSATPLRDTPSPDPIPDKPYQHLSREELEECCRDAEAVSSFGRRSSDWLIRRVQAVKTTVEDEEVQNIRNQRDGEVDELLAIAKSRRIRFTLDQINKDIISLDSDDD